MNSTLFEMEMERLDNSIDKARKQFYSALLGKKRRVKRTWLEISALTNAHLLQILPYRAMLGHVAKVAVERDKVIAEILAAKESQQTENFEENVDERESAETFTVLPSEHSFSSTGLSGRDHQFARDEAVQTEESSFAS